MALLNPRKTIETTIMEPMEVHGFGQSYDERREMVLDLLDKVGLPGARYLNRYPHEFSGGQGSDLHCPLAGGSP